MTVQGLINRLQKIEDKTLPVVAESDGSIFGQFVYEINDVTVTEGDIRYYDFEHDDFQKDGIVVILEKEDWS